MSSMSMSTNPFEPPKEGTTAWVFNGAGGTFPGGVFSSRQFAEAWIEQHKLSGTLTGYPVDTGVYEWVIDRGYWTPDYPSQQTSEFVQRFSSAYLEHYHYENGMPRT